MALNANALTDLATAKSYLKAGTDTANDAIIELFINASSEYLERECDRVFKAQAFTEIRSGRKQNLLMLKQWPVNTISSLHIDGTSVFGAGSLIPASEYQIADDNNSILLLNQVFPNGFNNVKVVYNAGFSTYPADLVHACLWLVSYYRNLRDGQDIGRPRKSKGDENTEILQTAPQEVKDAIARYKRTEFPISDALTWNE